jgi:hypothetical protein
MRSFLAKIKNVLLWSYARGTWQYDVLCLIIIAVIFLVPGRYFGDRDRTGLTRANDNRFLASNIARESIEISSSELENFLKKENRTDLLNSPGEATVLYIREHLKKDAATIRVETVKPPDGRTVYRVWIFQD